MKKAPLLALLLFAGCTDVREAHDELHGDHKLTQAEIDKLDLDGDGKLDADELEQHHDDVAALHADRGAAFFAQADADHDGKLTAAELDAAPDPGPMIVGHLAMIDTDGDGAVTQAELAAAIALHEHHD
jgi:Ca2+-binding EF-hand superfamily protein